jgi:hypothetical protein
MFLILHRPNYTAKILQCAAAGFAFGPPAVARQMTATDICDELVAVLRSIEERHARWNAAA